MTSRTTLILVDSDIRRRAAVTHTLAGGLFHVEPFEHAGELMHRWPSDGLILVHDNGRAVQQLVEAMAEMGHWLPLVAFAERPETGRVVQAILAGAIDYLDWPFGEAEVQQTVLVAEQSRSTIGNARLREAMARGRVQKLTPREREVLAGVAQGLSNRGIGEQLAISPRTVEIHRANMLSKIGANHTSEAIRIAIEASLVG